MMATKQKQITNDRLAIADQEIQEFLQQTSEMGLSFSQFKAICRSDFGTDPIDDRRAFSQHNGVYEFQNPTATHYVTHDSLTGLWFATFNGATGQGFSYSEAWAAVKVDEQSRWEAFLASQPDPL